MPSIRILEGNEKGATAELAQSPLVFGRDPASAIPLTDKGVSRQHAQIFRIGEMAFIRDLESRNGTFVNDQRVTEELLRDGDRIQLGSTLLAYEDAHSAQRRLVFHDGHLADAVELRLEDLSSLHVDEGNASSARHLRVLFRLGRLLAAADSEAALLEQALPFAAGALHADGAHVFIRDLARDAITPAGTWSRDITRPAEKISRTIIRRAISDQRALMTADAMADVRFAGRESIVEGRIQSVICAPLAVDGGLPGALYLSGGGGKEAFGEEDLELAAALADQMGLALSRLRAEARRAWHLLTAVRALERAAEARCLGQSGHSERLAAWTLPMARAMGIPPPQRINLQLAALLHHAGRAVLEPDQMRDGEALARATHELASHMGFFNEIEPILRLWSAPELLSGGACADISGDEAALRPARILALAHRIENTLRPAPSDGPPDPGRLAEAVGQIGSGAAGIIDRETVSALLAAHREGQLERPLDEQWRDEFSLGR